MLGLEELKTAYKNMADECSFIFKDAIYYNEDGNASWKLVFDYFGVGIRMSFEYEYLVENDPLYDDIMFYGDPYIHFSIYCYRIMTIFIEVLQKNRTDKDTMNAFIMYLKEKTA